MSFYTVTTVLALVLVYVATHPYRIFDAVCKVILPRAHPQIAWWETQILVGIWSGLRYGRFRQRCGSETSEQEETKIRRGEKAPRRSTQAKACEIVKS